MKKLLLIITLLFSGSAIAETFNSKWGRNAGWIYGTSHISTEITIRLIQSKKEVTFIERLFASTLTGAILAQAVRNSSNNDKELWINSVGAAAGITTGNLLQMNWDF